MNRLGGHRDPWTETWAVARLISPFIDPGAGRELLRAPGQSPTCLIDRAAAMNVLPALGLAVANKALFDALSDVENEVLATSYELNTLTNRNLAGEAARISEKLDAGGITFAFLKGTARILRDHDQAPGQRKTGDIDLLVAPCHAQRARDVLTSELGYTVISVAPAGGHAWGALTRGDGGVTVDLHVRPGPQSDLLSTAEALAGRTRVSVAGQTVPVVGATHWILHAMFHAQVQDRHHARAYPGLRAHEDIAWATAHLPGADWSWIEARFARAGYASIYRDARVLNKVLCGGPGSGPAGVTARLHVRRVKATCRSERLRSITDLVVAILHLLHRASVRERYPHRPLWLGRLAVAAGALRRHGTNAPGKIRFLVNRYRSAHGP